MIGIWKNIKDGFLQFQRRTEGESYRETFPQDEEPYEEMLADFAQAVLEKRPVRVNGLEGLNSLELTNAAYLSAWMGAPVSLPIDEVQYERELEKRIREEI